MSVSEQKILARIQKIAKEIMDLSKRVSAMERAPQAKYVSFSGTQTVYDENGQIRSKLGLQDDGTYTNVDLNGPPPQKPAQPTVDGSSGSLVVSSYGLAENGIPWPLDFKGLEVHVGATDGFALSLATLITTWERDGGLVTIPLAPGTYWAALRVITTSGEYSPISNYVSSEVIALPSDGFAPATSPTAVIVEGGIGSLFVKWPPDTDNHDLVSYEVHVSLTSGFTPDMTTLSGVTSGSMYTIRKLPDGSILNPNVTYYVKVWSKDEDGYAPSASPEVSGSPNQVTGPDISANAVTADNIRGNAITGDKLAADFALVNNLQIGPRINIHPDSGIQIDLDDGEISFPSDGTPASITASLNAHSITISNFLRLRGLENYIEGALSLNNVIDAPKKEPEVANFFDPSGPWTLGGGPSSDLSFYSPMSSVVEVDSNTVGFITYADDGTDNPGFVSINKTTFTVAITNFSGTPSNVLLVGGLGIAGGNYYVAGINLATGKQIVIRYNSSGAYSTSWPVNIATSGGNAGNILSLTTDGTTIWTLYQDGVTSNNFVVSSNMTGGSENVVMRTTVKISVCLAFMRGSFDLGASRFIIAGRTNSGSFRAYSLETTGNPATRHTSEEFYPYNNVSWESLGWDSTVNRFIGILRDNQSPYLIANYLVYLSPNTSTVSRTVKYTWYDSVSGLETNASPAASYTQHARGWIRVVVDSIPGAGGINEPDGVKIYIDNHEQNTPAPGVTAAFYDGTDNTGPNSPASNGFAALSNPGLITSEALDSNGDHMIILGGNGAAKLPGYPRKIGQYSTTTASSTTADGVQGNVGSISCSLVAGRTYRATWVGMIDPGTSGMYTNLDLKHGVGASVGGSVFQRYYTDHRAAGRIVSAHVVGEFVAATTQTENIVAVLMGNGGTASTFSPAAGYAAWMIVEEIAEV